MVAMLTLPVVLRTRADTPRVRRVVQALVVLWILSMADLYFTIWAHRYTPFHEANPVARVVLEAGSVTGIVLLKLGLMAMGTGIFWFLRRHARAEIGLWVIVLAYVVLTFYWADYTNSAMALGPWDE